MFERFDYLDCVDSTNEYLKRFLSERVPHMVVAREQTRGKGQYGRHWYSAADRGLYVSYLFFPDWSASRLPLLNMICSLAVVQTLRGVGVAAADLRLKPPNDVLLRGRKVSGVLVELGTLGQQISWVIAGFGINLYHETFPAGLETATSLRLEGIEVVDSLEFCESLTEHLVSLIRRVEEKGEEEVEAAYRKAANLRQ